MEVILTLDQVAQLSGAKVEDLKALTEDKEQKEASEAVFGAANQNIQDSLKRLKDRNDDFLKRGLREKGEAVEKALRPLVEKLEIEGFKADKEGLNALVNAIEQGGSQKVDLSNLTPQQISELPAYQKALEATQAANAKAEQVEKEFAAYKSAETQRKVDSAWSSSVAKVLEQKKAFIGKSTYQDAAQTLINTIPTNRRSIDDQGNPIALDENGQPLTDEFGKSVSFDSFVVSNYKFGFNVGNPDSSGSGAGAGASSGSGGSSGLTITSEEQGRKLVEKYHQAGDRDNLAKARRAYREYLANQPTE